MKRLPESELNRVAAAYLKDMVCRYGAKNLNRLSLRIRKLAKQNVEVR